MKFSSTPQLDSLVVTGIPEIKYDDMFDILDDITITQNFNEFFANKGQNLGSAIKTSGLPKVNDANHARDSVFALELINEPQLIEIINSVKGDSAPGWDETTSKTIKDYFLLLLSR